MIPGFSTRLAWERRSKSFMANWKDWGSENENAIELNCKVVKKVATPPFSDLSPLSSKKFRNPPKWLNFWKIRHPHHLGEGGSNYEHPLVIFQVAANFLINQLQNIFTQGILHLFFIPKRKLHSPLQNRSFYHISYYF